MIKLILNENKPKQQPYKPHGMSGSSFNLDNMRRMSDSELWGRIDSMDQRTLKSILNQLYTSDEVLKFSNKLKRVTAVYNALRS